MSPPDASNLKAVNGYLAKRSYLEGYTPSQLDVSYFNAIGTITSSQGKKGLQNVYRWHLHIASFSEAERARWPGKAAELASSKTKKDAEDDLFGDDDDLFGDDDDDELAEIKKKAAEKKKKKKEKPPQKTLMILEIKPFDDETDLKALEKKIRTIDETQLKGMVCWGVEAKLEPIGYGIHKLIMSIVVYDEKCCEDDIRDILEERFADDIQSIEVPTMSKV